MTWLFKSKSCGHFNLDPPNSFTNNADEIQEEDDEDDVVVGNQISTPLMNPMMRQGSKNEQFAIVDILAAALRKSLATCSVECDEVSSMDISYPTEVRHVSHVTFDQSNGFLGLPFELESEVPRRLPSASANVFGVSAKSMQCSYDERGNNVPTILLLMQKRLYSEEGLKGEGIFRLTAEDGQEEHIRDQLNKGFVPHGIDVHCLAGLIKAWLRELPTGVLDSLTPEQVLLCNTEDDCTRLIMLLPPTEAALLDWAINLMVDVAQHEQYNKMNAHNIAMVFAPNMTQMADPVTALMHAVQVMNLLKTLILKTLRERVKSAAEAGLLSSCIGSPGNMSESYLSNSNPEPSSEPSVDGCVRGPVTGNFLRSATLNIVESPRLERHRILLEKNGVDEYNPISGYSVPTPREMGALENRYGGEYDTGDWLSLRKGVRRLCRHPVFQLSKQAKKGDIEIVHTVERDGVLGL